MSGQAPPSEPISQKERWRDKAGDAWAYFQAEIDATFAPFNDALLGAAAPDSGERALDVGCGCGATSLSLARLGLQVTGLDLSPSQLDVARKRAAAEKLAIEFLEQDASRFESPRPVDLIASRLGFMFFDDPVQAFANLRRQAPNGRAALLCWAEIGANPWMHLARDSAAGLLDLPDPPPPGSPGPFGFDDPDRLRRVLDESGWQRIEIARLETSLAVAGGAPEDVLRLSMKLGPVAPLIAAAEEPVRTKVRDSMAARLAPWTRDGHVAFPAAAWIATARA